MKPLRIDTLRYQFAVNFENNITKYYDFMIFISYICLSCAN